MKAAQGLEVAGERVRLRVRPEPYVGCDAEQHVVAGEEHALRLVVECELVVGVAGGVDDASRSASEREPILRPQRQHFLRQRQVRSHRGGGRLGSLTGHAVPDQVLDERLLSFELFPEPARKGDLLLQHVYWRP